MSTLDETALHQRLLARQPAAIDDLTDRHGAQIYHLARRIIGAAGSEQDSEEVAADAVAAAWQRAAEFDPKRSSLGSWMLMLTKYLALDRRHNLLRQRFTAAGEARLVPLAAAPEPVASPTPEQAAIDAEGRRRLHQALGRLPPADRELLERRYFLAQPIGELARELNLSRSALDNRLWRARRALRELLQDAKEVGSR